MKNPDALQARANVLHLHGLLAHWPEASAGGWPEALIGWEEDERARRSLERRLQSAHIGRFKPLCDFDWSWPTAIDRGTFEALMSLDFLKDATNAVLVGPNGVGKSTLARNLAHEAVIHGHTVLFTTAGQLLGELASLDSDAALRRRLRRYVAPALLLIDEVGYLSYSNRHADLMFELISRRYVENSVQKFPDSRGKQRPIVSTLVHAIIRRFRWRVWGAVHGYDCRDPAPSFGQQGEHQFDCA